MLLLLLVPLEEKIQSRQSQTVKEKKSSPPRSSSVELKASWQAAEASLSPPPLSGRREGKEEGEKVFVRCCLDVVELRYKGLKNPRIRSERCELKVFWVIWESIVKGKSYFRIRVCCIFSVVAHEDGMICAKKKLNLEAHFFSFDLFLLLPFSLHFALSLREIVVWLLLRIHTTITPLPTHSSSPGSPLLFPPSPPPRKPGSRPANRKAKTLQLTLKNSKDI